MMTSYDHEDDVTRYSLLGWRVLSRSGYVTEECVPTVGDCLQHRTEMR